MGLKTEVGCLDVTRVSSDSSLVIGDNLVTSRSKEKQNYGLELTTDGEVVAPVQQVNHMDADRMDISITSTSSRVSFVY